MSEFQQPKTRLVQIQIPPDLQEGSLMHVEYDGKMFSITVPPGVKSGDTIAVEIVDAVAPPLDENAERLPPYSGQEEEQQTPWVQDAERQSSEPGEGESVDGAIQPAQKKEISKTRAGLGAAAVGATVGFLLVGPITGVVVAGVALYATTRNDQIGAAAVGVGGVAVKGYDKTKEFAEKHDVYNRMKAAGAGTAKKVGEIDQQYGISKKVNAATKATVSKAVEINNKYDLTGQAARGIMSAGSAINRLVNKPAAAPTPVIQAQESQEVTTLK